MTVQELIDLLQKVENKNVPVIVSNYTENKVYPVAYTEAVPAFFQDSSDKTFRIETHLPEGMYTVERKRK
jgi:hypothetical protein